MKLETIAALLAGLTGTASSIACSKAQPTVTEVPASTDAPAESAEHACGNHAEGACAGDARSEPATDAAASRTFEIAPGEFAEANFQMSKGAKVTVAFAEGSAEIAWDVHSHDHAGGAKIHDQGKGGAGTIEFVAPSDGVFSILWKNTGSSATPMQADVTLGEGATIHSWMPAE